METLEVAKLFERAAGVLAGARCLVAFTGAGVSAESGIPVFRGASGIRKQYDQRHLDLDFFEREPATAWETIRSLFYAEDPEPNDAHRILASWEADGILDFLVTQNIDGLHRSAGSLRVAEFHGTAKSLSCMRCGAVYPADPVALAALGAAPSGAASLPPRCASCDGVLKPDFIFFGEAIPEAAGKDAFDAADRADACLVIGSTGLVYPAASIPEIVASNGGAIVEINPEATRFSRFPETIFLPSSACAAMRALDPLVRGHPAVRGRHGAGLP